MVSVFAFSGGLSRVKPLRGRFLAALDKPPENAMVSIMEGWDGSDPVCRVEGRLLHMRQFLYGLISAEVILFEEGANPKYS